MPKRFVGNERKTAANAERLMSSYCVDATAANAERLIMSNSISVGTTERR